MVSDSPQTSVSSQSTSLDLFFENHGSVCLIRAVSEVGQQWLDENVGDDDMLMFGDAIVCEPRYVAAILLGAQSDGLAVRG